MQISGIIYSEDRKKSQDRFQEAVNRAHFLDENEKKHWHLLGFILTTEQLRQAEHLIIDEDLRRLATQEKLEKIKPSTQRRYG